MHDPNQWEMKAAQKNWVGNQKNTKLIIYKATCFKDVQEQGLFLKAQGTEELLEPFRIEIFMLQTSKESWSCLVIPIVRVGVWRLRMASFNTVLSRTQDPNWFFNVRKASNYEASQPFVELEDEATQNLLGGTASISVFCQIFSVVFLEDPMPGRSLMLSDWCATAAATTPTSFRWGWWKCSSLNIQHMWLV